MGRAGEWPCALLPRSLVTGPLLSARHKSSRSIIDGMNRIPLNRRRFLAASGTGPILSAVATRGAQSDASPAARDIIDCQSHLFFPAVLERMRKRSADPVVYEKDGTTWLRMGDWLRKVPPSYLSVEEKLAAMDRHGISVTLLSTNDPGPEWFGEDGAEAARLLHDSLADVAARHSGRFRGLCTLPMQNEAAAAAELDRCVVCGQGESGATPLVSIDLERGGVQCRGCRSGVGISAGALHLLRDVLDGRLGEALDRAHRPGGQVLDDPVVAEVASIATRAFEFHVERRLRSVAIFERHDTRSEP